MGQSGQSEDNVKRAREILRNLDIYHLVAFEMLTRSFKSFLLALAIKEHLLAPDRAVYAANLELNLQAQQWGHIRDFHLWHNACQLSNAHLALVFFSSLGSKN